MAPTAGRLTMWLSLLAGWLACALAQTPSDRWRTVHTEHYRLHYPVPAEAWALDAATQLEDIRARVVAEVGWAPDEVVDVRIADPVSDANGFAIPLWNSPRMELWATAPQPASNIGHYRGWGELLITHEDAHLVHLLRESRNPFERALQGLLGFGPVTSRSPRWVIEGYATVVEGRLTGSGRPHGDGRPQLLRTLAQEGRMPSYGELSGGPRWAGYAFAYLVGSAYLEWLEERAGVGSLRDLWARMSAREVRSFDVAFIGVFGDSPAVLYGRFVAELTAEAMAVEAARPADDDTLFLDRPWGTGNIALSVDGEALAIPVEGPKGPPSLQVVATAEDADAVAKREERIAEVLERDPLDVAPVPPAAPPHEVTHSRTYWLRTARHPRWLADETGVLFSAWVPDITGRLRPDLFVWDPESGREWRITRGADLPMADPAPDGSWAVAVHTVWGQSQLVRVDLDSGSWVALTERSVDVVVTGPRLAPDGERLAWLEHRDGRWGVQVRHLDSGETWSWRPAMDGPAPTHVAWTRDGHRLLASVGQHGFAEIWELLDHQGAGRGRVTQSRGGALAVEPTLDGSAAYHLSADHRGFDVLRSELVGRGAEPAVPRAPAGRPPSVITPPVIREPQVAEPYGVGPIDVSPLLAGAASSREHGQATLGVRLGDPVGRFETSWVASLAGGADGRRLGASGGRASATYQGLPARLHGDLYALTDDAFGLGRFGAVVDARQTLRLPWGRAEFGGGGFLERPLGADPHFDRDALFVVGDVGIVDGRRGLWGLAVASQLQVGQSGANAWWRGIASGSAVLFRGPSLRLSGRTGVVDGGPPVERFRLGGVQNSVQPLPTRAWRAVDAAYRPDAASGTWHHLAEAAIDTPVSLSVRRHWLGADGEPPTTATAVGARLEMPISADPFVRIPEMSVDTGVACVLEDPATGWSAAPCQSLTDWSVWAGITLRP